MLLIQIVLLAALLVAFLVTWKRARQKVISIVETLSWSALWIIAAIVITLPGTTTSVANFFGVGRGVDFVLYASVLTLFFLVFKIFVSLDRIERNLTEIVRQDALKDLEERHE